MHIVVNSIMRNDTELKVSFSTVFGRAEAGWNGDEPHVGSEYDVELDIDQTLHWGVNIEESPVETSSIVFDDDTGIIVTGQLESLDDDGFGVIRLGNFVIAVVITGDQPSKHIGRFVLISKVKVKLYPYNL